MKEWKRINEIFPLALKQEVGTEQEYNFGKRFEVIISDNKPTKNDAGMILTKFYYKKLDDKEIMWLRELD